MKLNFAGAYTLNIFYTLQLLNPSESFGKIMIEYPWDTRTTCSLILMLINSLLVYVFRTPEKRISIRRYVECTSSVIQALALFRELYPRHWRQKQIDYCISKAANYIESIQRSDGSWFVLRSQYYICIVFSTHVLFNHHKNMRSFECELRHPSAHGW